jgi:hypothetical protein
MRKQLAEINNVRAVFRAIVVRFGEKKAYKGPPLKTILLQDVRDRHNRVMTDHLWFTAGKWSETLGLEPGDEIEFEARVSQYRKGYRGRREDFDLPAPSIDYRLSFPTKVKKLRQPFEADAKQPSLI